MSASAPQRRRLASLRFFIQSSTIFGIILLLGGAALIVVGSVSATHSNRTHQHARRGVTIKHVPFTDLVAATTTHDIRSAVLDESSHLLAYTKNGRSSDVFSMTTIPNTLLSQQIDALTRQHVPLRVIDPEQASPVTANSRLGAATANTTQGRQTLTDALTGKTSDTSGGAPTIVFGAIFTVIGLGLLGFGVVRGVSQLRDEQDATSDPTTIDLPRSTAGSPAWQGRTRAAASGSPAHLTHEVEQPDTRFDDVAGCEEAVNELRDLVAFLKDPDEWTRLGARRPKGALLVGPPGTGKTLLARAVAGEAGVPFIAASGSDFVEVYVGVGAQRVREMAASARKHKTAIIFIDEIDAIGAARSDGKNRDPEADRTLNALLTEMDGFGKDDCIVFLAATNRPDLLDKALTRPGRLDTRVEVPNPDRRGREAILSVHMRDKILADDVDVNRLALRTPGFSGASLSKLVDIACLDATRRGLTSVPQECFDEAVAVVVMGRPRLSAVVTDHDAQVTAWHEAGHTLTAWLQPDADDPVKVSIIPRGQAGGVTWMRGNDNLFLTRRQAHAQLVTAMGGRVGEEFGLGGEFTQGPCHDFQSATDLATRMVAEYGMTDTGLQFRSPSTSSADMVTDAVEELLQNAYRTAKNLLNEHETLLRAVVASLLERRELDLTDIDAIAAATSTTPKRHLTVPPPPSFPSRTDQARAQSSQRSGHASSDRDDVHTAAELVAAAHRHQESS